MSRVCAWSYTAPTFVNMSAVITPCANIWSTAPFTPMSFIVARPIST